MQEIQLERMLSRPETLLVERKVSRYEDELPMKTRKLDMGKQLVLLLGQNLRHVGCKLEDSFLHRNPIPKYPRDMLRLMTGSQAYFRKLYGGEVSKNPVFQRRRLMSEVQSPGEDHREPLH